MDLDYILTPPPLKWPILFYSSLFPPKICENVEYNKYTKYQNSFIFNLNFRGNI